MIDTLTHYRKRVSSPKPLEDVRYCCAESGCGRGFGDPEGIHNFLIWRAAVEDHLRQMHGIHPALINTHLRAEYA